MSVIARKANLNLERYRVLTSIFLLTLIGLYLLTKYTESKSTITLLYILAFFQLSPFIIAYFRKKFTYLDFVLISHFISFTLQIYNSYSKFLPELDSATSTINAIKEQLNCTFIIIATYYITRFFMFHSYIERPNYDYLSVNLKWFLIIGVYSLFVPAYIQYIPASLLIIHFSLVGIDLTLLFTSSLRGYERLATIIRLLAFFSALWSFIITGFLTAVGNYITLLFTTSCLRKKYKNFFYIGLITLLASALQTVKNDYRTFGSSYPSIKEKIEYLVTSLYLEYFSDEKKDSKKSNEKLLEGFSRSGDESLERVLRMTPSVVPFWNGKTYEHIPYIFIPRFLWPTKPSRHFWHEFGIKYGYLSEDDWQTSVAVSFLAEGYMNFGYAGLYGIAAIFAIILAIAERISYYFLKGNFMLTFLVFLMPFIPYQNDFGTMINSFVIVTCVMFMIRSILLKMAKRDAYGYFY